MSVLGKHGITTTTPSNTLLGAGTYLKGLKWDSEASKWTGTIIGATNGGGKVSIVGELMDLEIDGALVKFKGQTVKQGGTASMEVNFAEVNGGIIQMGTLFGKATTSDVTGYDLFEDKATISEGDYVDNFGFVGKTADGSKDIIVIFESALCTSGFEIEPKNKEASVVKLTMECYAENNGDLDTLPIKIYYPKASA